MDLVNSASRVWCNPVTLASLVQRVQGTQKELSKRRPHIGFDSWLLSQVNNTCRSDVAREGARAHLCRVHQTATVMVAGLDVVLRVARVWRGKELFFSHE